MNIQNADFRAFESIPSCCPRYENGTGSGLSMGVFYDIPLSEQIRIALRAGYTGLGGTFVRMETTEVKGGRGVFEHTIKHDLPLLVLNRFFSSMLAHHFG